MKPALLVLPCLLLDMSALAQSPRPSVASWYGEEHRGRLMANGKRFDPDKLTAASWFYPLGTQVRVTVNSPVYKNSPPPSVLVTITDRGPARRLVRNGRKIDLAHAAFKALAHPDIGLVDVTVTTVNDKPSALAANGTAPVYGPVTSAANGAPCASCNPRM